MSDDDVVIAQIRKNEGDSAANAAAALYARWGNCSCPDPWCPTRGHHDEGQFGPLPVTRSHMDALLEDRDELRIIARWLSANGLAKEWEDSRLSVGPFVIRKLGFALYGEDYHWHPDNVDGG